MDPLSQGECRGAEELREKVLEAGLCAACGACLGFCPYLKTFGEQMAVIHNCGICGGVCSRICPRLETDYDSLRRRLFGELDVDLALGAHLAVYFARAADEKVRSLGQYGGTVTALGRYALQQGLVDCLLAAGGGPGAAAPVLCSTPEEISGAAGSKYTAVPTLSLYQKAVESGNRQVGLIGRPCQVTAARKMEQVAEIRGERIALVLGLFCFWALAPDFYTLLRDRGLSGSSRMDIPKDAVHLLNEGLQHTLPLAEVRPYIKQSCQSCYDPLAELADVAVGSTEYDPAWNTLLVRTTRGEQLVREAEGAGALELRPYPPEILPVLQQAVLNKKKRVLKLPGAACFRISPGEKEILEGGGQK